VTGARLFDEWPAKYDQWFETPIGRLIERVESELLLEVLRPERGDRILDAGCGTGVFTRHLIDAGAHVAGLDLSFPMLRQAGKKLTGSPFYPVQADMRRLPFGDNTFDKAVSITAIEFIEDAADALDELFRVTRPAGRIVVATLNSLSPWADRRKGAGEKGHSLFSRVFFRSPDQLRRMTIAANTVIRSAVHFQKDDDPVHALRLEEKGRADNLETGAFLLAAWEKPATYTKTS